LRITPVLFWQQAGIQQSNYGIGQRSLRPVFGMFFDLENKSKKYAKKV
jgi:hypothetical protein